MSARDPAGPAGLKEEGRGFSPVWWLPLAALIVAADYRTGPFVQFPFLYTLPVGLAAWYHGLRWALPLAALLPLARLWYTPLWNVPGVAYQPYVNAGVRILVLSLIAVLTARVSAQSRALQREVRRLQALLPICSHCKHIRDEHDEWVRLESYFSAQNGTRFTHCICPDCMRRLYPDVLDEDERGAGGAG